MHVFQKSAFINFRSAHQHSISIDLILSRISIRIINIRIISIRISKQRASIRIEEISIMLYQKLCPVLYNMIHCISLMHQIQSLHKKRYLHHTDLDLQLEDWKTWIHNRVNIFLQSQVANDRCVLLYLCISFLMVHNRVLHNIVLPYR